MDDVSVIFEMYSTRVLPFNQTVMAAVEKLGRLLGDILVRAPNASARSES